MSGAHTAAEKLSSQNATRLASNASEAFSFREIDRVLSQIIRIRDSVQPPIRTSAKLPDDLFYVCY
jgi:hypothetical protein